jgi:hypothetical protein
MISTSQFAAKRPTLAFLSPNKATPMSRGKLSNRVACLLPLFALSACAGAASGVMSANESIYVASVEVLEHDMSAPAAFADTLRDEVLAGAAFYGATGRPVVVRIDLDRVHFKNALRALTIGDDNQAKGRIAVLDSATGQQLASFALDVDAETAPLSDTGTFIAIGVIGAFDPTGIVDIASTVGSAASADINRSGTAAGMRANLTAETLRQTFGDVRTKAVIAARRNQKVTPAK